MTFDYLYPEESTIHSQDISPELALKARKFAKMG